MGISKRTDHVGEKRFHLHYPHLFLDNRKVVPSKAGPPVAQSPTLDMSAEWVGTKRSPDGISVSDKVGLILLTVRHVVERGIAALVSLAA